MTQDNSSKSFYRESIFAVPMMDCPSEENLIRMALSHVDGVQSLTFNLPARQFKAVHQGMPDALLQQLQPLKLGASLVVSEAVAIPENQQGDYRESVFSVPRMDCPSEENLIRMAVRDIPELQSLSFDLGKREVKAVHQGKPDAILEKLTPLNLGAVLRESKQTAPEATLAKTNSADDAAEARTLRLLLGINAVMFFVELAVGWFAQSTGLIADSLDMFADAAVYGLALYAVGHAVSRKAKAAHMAGWLQLLLALGALSEVFRRFIFGSDPASSLMMGMGLLALVANVACLLLIAGKRDSGAHMKASYIFSTNDVIANLGVIAAGMLVRWTNSSYPDLVIGTVIGIIVLNGARKILRLK